MLMQQGGRTKPVPFWTCRSFSHSAFKPRFTAEGLQGHVTLDGLMPKNSTCFLSTEVRPTFSASRLDKASPSQPPQHKVV